MISENEIESLGLLGRNSWRRMVQELGEDEFFVMWMDGIPVPWRVEQLDLTFAEKYAGTEVFRFVTDDEDEEDEDLTWEDLIGYEVYDGAERLGVVSDVDETTINTLLILDDGRMIPAHEDLILSLDMEEEKLIMNLPNGL